MPLFDYVGFDAGGKKVSGVIDAAGKRVALQKLHEQGVFPTSLREESAAAGRTQRWQFSRRVSSLDLAAATRQLATLLGAGLPLDEALSIVVEQLEHATLTRVVGRVRELVMQGESLAGALSQQGRVFPALYANMVQVGENSGTLDQVLHRLADFLEEQTKLRSRLQAALAYPILMAFVGTGVLCFLLAFVVPKVTQMISDLGEALPLPTRLLIGGSNFVQGYWWLLLLILGTLTFAAVRYARTDRGRRRLDRLALTAPLFGKLNLQIATARLTRTLGTLLHSGVPLLSALDISRNLLGNRLLRETLADTAAAVREGEGLAAPLKRAGIFPPMVTQMAAVGERSGELETMLFRVAEAYEHQVDMTLTGLLSLLEPLMILVMGTVVGFIVMAILLPIFQASSGM